jgi:hypothetical protein
VRATPRENHSFPARLAACGHRSAPDSLGDIHEGRRSAAPRDRREGRGGASPRPSATNPQGQRRRITVRPSHLTSRRPIRRGWMPPGGASFLQVKEHRWGPGQNPQTVPDATLTGWANLGVANSRYEKVIVMKNRRPISGGHPSPQSPHPPRPKGSSRGLR